MIEPRHEELAALTALGWMEDRAQLERAAALNPEVAQTMREFAEVAAALAFSAPQVEAPAHLRQQVLDALGPDAAPSRAFAKPSASVPIFRFPRFALMPYAIAACLMGIALFQTAIILLLDRQIDSAHVPSPRHDPFNGVQLVDLAPQGDHGAAKVMVAWNGKTCCGMLSMADMPDAPAGSDYQLWVLDPTKPAPMNAGVIPRGIHSQHFIAGDVTAPGRPGFAISMEPAGGRTEPTPNAILFAVAPSP